MGWRGIPILAALSVMAVARILYDPMPSSAPAAVANTTTDGATDLSRIDFTPWLSPTTAPTTAPTTMPLTDQTSDQPDTIEQSAAASTDHLLTFFRRIALERFQWNGVANQPASGIATNSFDTPAIDVDSAYSPNLADFTGGYSPEFSSSAKNKSPEITPAAPFSDRITSANDPAYSIVGFDIPANTPISHPVNSLPPISVPEPSTTLLALATLGLARHRS